MALRINTNVAALNAHKNMIMTDNSLSSSLERLSSGLRINKAADDAAGMSIADSLKSQALGLGQAIKNGNDGINIVQTADAALQESINIVNAVKTKAIQSAQDGQTTESRAAIQADIDKLLEELDTIANTTAFNNQKLLSGNFTNKKFQIGAYSGETLGISIASAQSQKIGHVTKSELTMTNDAEGTVQLSIYSNINNANFQVQSVDVLYNNDATNSMGALANNINKFSDQLGISAAANVVTQTDAAVQAGTTDSDFSINGVTIGQFDIIANDDNGALVKAINQKTKNHGVVASTNSAGYLTLTSSDGRAIEVTATSITDGTNTGVNAVLGGSDMSTLGGIILQQNGSNEIIVNDIGGGAAVSLQTDLEISGDTTTTISSVAAAGSTLESGSKFQAGWTTGEALLGSNFTGDLVTAQSSTLTAGSTLGAGSILGSGTVLQGVMITSGVDGTGGDYTIAAGSMLSSGSVLSSGTVFGANIAATADYTLTENSILAAGSSLACGTELNSGTVIGGNLTLSADGGTLTVNAAGTAILASGSILIDNSELASGTTLTTAVSSSGVNLSGTAVIGGGSTITNASTLVLGTQLASGEFLQTTTGQIGSATGFTLDADYVLDGDQTTSFSLSTFGGSIISSGSTLAVGTVFQSNDIATDGDLTLTADMILQGSSSLASGSTIGVGSVFANDEVTVHEAPLILTQDMTAVSGTVVADESILATGTILNDVEFAVEANTVLTNSMVLGTDSTIMSGSVLQAGSIIGTDGLGNTAQLTLTGDMNVGQGSTFASTGTSYNTDSTIGATATLGNDLILTQDMTLAAASLIKDGSILTDGSGIGGAMTLANDEVVETGSEMLVTNGTELAAGSIITEGTFLTSDIVAADGNTYTQGSILASDITTAGTNTLTADMTLQAGSTLAAGSVLAANADSGTYATTETGTSELSTLSDVDVLTQEGAQVAIAVADAALKDLDKVRADLGSVQNQISFTIANISTTRVNIYSAESTIRDVDFAEESSNFTKMQILQQAGTFAMSQANASSQAVLSLLQ